MICCAASLISSRNKHYNHLFASKHNLCGNHGWNLNLQHLNAGKRLFFLKKKKVDISLPTKSYLVGVLIIGGCSQVHLWFMVHISVFTTSFPGRGVPLGLPVWNNVRCDCGISRHKCTLHRHGQSPTSWQCGNSRSFLQGLGQLSS